MTREVSSRRFSERSCREDAAFATAPALRNRSRMKHAALVLLLVCHVARADTGEAPKSRSPHSVRSRPRSEPELGRPRSTAVMLSLAGTAVPFAMMYGGVELGG